MPFKPILDAPPGLYSVGFFPRVCPRPSDYTLGYLPAAPLGQEQLEARQSAMQLRPEI